MYQRISEITAHDSSSPHSILPNSHLDSYIFIARERKKKIPPEEILRDNKMANNISYLF